MMPLRNLLYLLQLEEYGLERFINWLKNNPGRIVLEKKGRLTWTLKARLFFVLAGALNIFTFWQRPVMALKTTAIILSPFDTILKNLLVWRAHLKLNKIKSLTVIGITGSYGKTTTKDVISHVLTHKYGVLKTEGNYNTLLGIAKTILLNLRKNHEIFICEMAAYQLGDIKAISKLVKPKIGIITAIGQMHLERFGTEENILKTKLELIESLSSDGIGFMPKELESQIKNHHFAAKIEFFSSREDLLVKIGKIFSMAQDEILGRLKTTSPTPHRQEIIKTSAGITIIDDAYNSNPAGFLSALELLKNTPAQIKILVTPGMIELGEKQFELNKNAAMSATQVADYVIIVGETNKKALEEGLKEGFNLYSRTSGLEDSYADKEYNKRVFEVTDLDAAKIKLSELAISNSAVLLENDLPDHYF
ncbi:MAG: UDP-N-acetylmuramoyl-tripeptide--D-alanyl-D-alanine ligase [Candidatus Azambacteria bacterium]|nr:UDP-N-acetylmuramoyl-tripeptide--D-alanyl-D-alanine ligase [Candidatus Azambacteria bacterium]